MPLQKLLTEQEFIAGRAPRYAHYIVFSLLPWARLGSPYDVVTVGTPLARWRSKMVALFDGLANAIRGYPDVVPTIVRSRGP